MGVKLLPLVSGFASLGAGIVLVALFSPLDPLIADAQVGSAVLMILAGIYLVLFVSWRDTREKDTAPPGVYALIRRDIRGRAFRTITVGTAVAVIIGVLFATMLLTSGAAYSINSTRDKLGADIIVVPQQVPISSTPFYTLVYAGLSTTTSNGSVTVQSNPVYIDGSIERLVANVREVEEVTPQLLVSYFQPSGGCGGLNIVYVVAVDPASDFMLRGWLPNNVSASLEGNGVIAGAETPQPYQLPNNGVLYGVKLDVRATLPRTGTFVDHVLFVSMDTAGRMLQWQNSGNDPTVEGMQRLSYQHGQISALFVKLDSSSSHESAVANIDTSISGVRAYGISSLINSASSHFSGLLSIFSISGTIVWAGSLLLVGTLASLAINERTGEIGLIRALGASGNFVKKLAALQTLMVVSLAGLFGILAAWMVLNVPVLYDYLLLAVKVPYVAPPINQSSLLVVLAIILTLFTAGAAALWPASVASRKEAYEVVRQGSR